jgi:hypothetical protein
LNKNSKEKKNSRKFKIKKKLMKKNRNYVGIRMKIKKEVEMFKVE